MRFIFIIFIWVVILGGMRFYTWQRDAYTGPATVDVQRVVQAEGAYRLEITPTFSVEADPFALETDDSAAPPIQVRLNGQVLSLPDTDVERGKPLSIESVTGVHKGHNEVYLKASPPVSESTMAHALRIRLLEDGVELLDHTVWGSQGSLVSGSVGFEIGSAAKEAHED